MERRKHPVPPATTIILLPPVPEPEPEPVITPPVPVELPMPAHDLEPEDRAECR
jgi:hypothetical protein